MLGGGCVLIGAGHYWAWAGLPLFFCHSFSLSFSSVSVTAAGPQLVILWGPFEPEEKEKRERLEQDGLSCLVTLLWSLGYGRSANVVCW